MAIKWTDDEKRALLACDQSLVAAGLSALSHGLRARIEAGQRTYGALDLATDKRDFGVEAEAELLDALFYLAITGRKKDVGVAMALVANAIRVGRK
jgi:hypothetical protein